MALIGFRSPLTYHPWPWSEYTEEQKESVKIAEKVKSLLDGEYVCQLWCDNFFDLGQCTYHELLKKSLSFDYAIFIGGKDDYVRRESDRTHKYAARDNVYLEFGLYAGILTYGPSLI